MATRTGMISCKWRRRRTPPAFIRGGSATMSCTPWLRLRLATIRSRMASIRRRSWPLQPSRPCVRSLLQRPVPIWFGGHSTKARRRAAMLGDGWHGSYLSPEEVAPMVKELRQFRADSPRKEIPFTVHVHPHGVELTDSTLKDLIPAYEAV